MTTIDIIIDGSNGSIHRVGKGGAARPDGTSKRCEDQVRRLNRSAGFNRYKCSIRRYACGTKDAIDIEDFFTDWLRGRGHSLPRNGATPRPR